MSNVLQFRSFHKRHFSPEQVKYWQQQVLNQQQPNTSSQWQQYSNTVYDSRHPHYDYDYTNYPSEGLENKSETDVDMTEAEREEFDEEEGQQQQTTLSQEAIEIFKFSEAYRKERKFLMK
ncbi:hypothetical protein BDB00DRAFT_507671 [Zychaea mexicana]|uniref:uncharacterized protein n=1 Tax=Zychaea mexicana TaxID=64656 RepID=UPI0022FDEF47|nr:uncharacterized protein BDB00DRAFT_507671 [Zychaea mexicana]KAI9491271.1 hypothetical protein BDB00DRAFT_507671 [Zychaea mexicana]